MTRNIEFPGFDNGPLFDSILARLAPYGFKDSSWRNDSCPSIGRELPGGDFITVFVDSVYGQEIPAPISGPRLYVVLDGESLGNYPDIESAIGAALQGARPAGASGVSFAAPIETFESACEFIRDLESAGLLFHFEDSPAGIITGPDGAELFDREQCAELESRLSELYAFQWPGFDCPIGYALWCAGHYPAP